MGSTGIGDFFFPAEGLVASVHPLLPVLGPWVRVGSPS